MSENISYRNDSTKSLIRNFFSQLKLRSHDYEKLKISILPLIFAQILQRLYFVIDNHYIAKLGVQALLIHNIQFSFLYIGQYIGAATATSCLVFWRRQDYKDKQREVFYIHIFLCVVAALFCMVVADLFSTKILSYFNVATEYNELAKKYFTYGLVNMVLQAIFIGLFGVSVASGKERLTLLISGGILLFAIVIDSVAVNLFFSGNISEKSIHNPMLIIVLGNACLLIAAVFILLRFNKQSSADKRFLPFKDILKVWGNELGGGFLTSIDPIIYIFQLGLIITTSSLLITYQLLMQLAGIFCIPLMATMQISIRDASENFLANKPYTLPEWLRVLIIFGILPTEILMFFYLVCPQVFQFVYGYSIPFDHMSYVFLFIFGSIIGQLGNALTVPTRAKKKSYLVTIGYLISDFLVLLGGMQIILYFHFATPFYAGLVMLAYTIFYTIVNAFFAHKSIKIENIN